MTYTKWVPGAPYEFKPDADSAMYFTQRDGRQDMRSTYLNTWQDMGLINMSPSLVLEFE